MRNQRGSIMMETLLSCLILLILMFACVETVFLITDKVHLQRIVREAAREAAIMRSEGAGEDKGRDLARMYFGNRAGPVLESVKVTIREEKSGSATIGYAVAEAEFPHKIFGNALPWEVVNLNARAVFGWWDPALD